MLYPLKFKPFFKEKIWGGEKIRKVLHRPVGNMEHCGESWEISAIEGNVSVVSNGFFAEDNKGMMARMMPKVLKFSHDRKTASCVVCGNLATFDIVDGEFKLNFTEKELDRSRLRWGGKIEHSTEIKTQAQPAGTIKNLKELKQPYADFNPGVGPADETAYGNLKK